MIRELAMCIRVTAEKLAILGKATGFIPSFVYFETMLYFLTNHYSGVESEKVQIAHAWFQYFTWLKQTASMDVKENNLQDWSIYRPGDDLDEFLRKDKLKIMSNALKGTLDRGEELTEDYLLSFDYNKLFETWEDKAWQS